MGGLQRGEKKRKEGRSRLLRDPAQVPATAVSVQAAAASSHTVLTHSPHPLENTSASRGTPPASAQNQHANILQVKGYALHAISWFGFRSFFKRRYQDHKSIKDINVREFLCLSISLAQTNPSEDGAYFTLPVPAACLSCVLTARRVQRCHPAFQMRFACLPPLVRALSEDRQTDRQSPIHPHVPLTRRKR